MHLYGPSHIKIVFLVIISTTGWKVDDSVVGKLHGFALLGGGGGPLLWAGNGCVWGRQRLCCVIVSGLACA